jgi:CRISPR-associated protein Csc3
MANSEPKIEESYLPGFALEDDTPEEEKISLASEPLFSSLLRDVVAKQWSDDEVMADFVEYVAGPMSDHLGHFGAKGGEFVEERKAQGLKVEERYIPDQTMRGHLINGLFPVLHLAKTLQAWGAPQFRAYDDTVRRAFIAGYVLHDYLKLPHVEEQLEEAGFSHQDAVGPAQLEITERAFRQWSEILGLDEFLEPIGGVEAVLHDLIYIAANTQTRWGTLHNLSVLPNLSLHPVQRDLAEQLSRMADYLTYIVRTPQEVATDDSVQRELATLSNQTARFTYHHLADNRGVLSNFIHNAALKAMSNEHRVPLLYAASGVVYLEHKKVSVMPKVADVAEMTIEKIQEAIARQLHLSLDGIKRGGKGLKYAEYYWLFFDPAKFVELGVAAAFKNIHEGKKPSSGKRYTKIQNKGWLDPDEVDLDLPDDVRADQLAEWCYLAEKQIVDKLPEFDTQSFLLKAMGLEEIRDQFEAIPRDNRAGGVAYYWYFAAGHYLKRHPGLDPAAWREQVEALARQLTEAVREAAEEANLPPPAQGGDWDDLRAYISHTLTLGSEPTAGKERAAFAAELHRYQNAKKYGRGTTHMCALCSSAYRVDKQSESAILFGPQVYSNKLRLGGGQLRRDICSICGLEMMLRQNLMNRTAATGKDFENRRVRYLYFYPTYFFTPETLELFRRLSIRIKRISFTELRRQLIDEDGLIDFSPTTLQRLEPLLLEPEEDVNPEEDRYVRLHFPEHEPMTFYFLGVPPPGRDAKDAESWVHPAFLSLLIPLCVDVKVVASESPLPLMVEADEFNETVFLDGAHAAISYLTGGEKRVNVDRVLPTLQRLAVGYLIHIDANTAPGSNNFYRWQDLPALARALDESPMYAFHYLKKWQRKQKLDSIPLSKARQYLDYVTYLKGEDDMSHARHLTETYLNFYRAKGYSSNSILRPISIAARTVLDADGRLFDQEGLVEAVYGELYSYIDRAGREGLAYYPKGSDREGREEAMKEFADYFVNDLFYKTLQGDKSALRGKQLNLLKSACEVIYRDEVARQRDEDASA